MRVKRMRCALPLVAAACSGHAGDSCTTSLSGFGTTAYVICTDYFADGQTPEQRNQGCAQSGGRYSSGGCPDDDRIGRCYFAGELARSYYAPMTLASAEANCQGNARLGQDPVFKAD